MAQFMRKVELPLVWLILAAPGAWIVWNYATDAMSYAAFIKWSGDISVWLLILALAVTPVRSLFQGGWTQVLVRRRRDFGVGSFAYASGHLAVYLIDKADVALILSEGARIGLLTGWAAFAIFLPLVLTSNNLSRRLLKESWRKLHWLVYGAAALTMAHWLFTAVDPVLAIVHAVVIGVLLGLRAAPDWSQENDAPGD